MEAIALSISEAGAPTAPTHCGSWKRQLRRWQFAVTELVVAAPWFGFAADTALVATTYRFFTHAIPLAAGFELVTGQSKRPQRPLLRAVQS
jgi:hypothetical protein